MNKFIFSLIAITFASTLQSMQQKFPFDSLPRDIIQTILKNSNDELQCAITISCLNKKCYHDIKALKGKDLEEINTKQKLITGFVINNWNTKLYKEEKDRWENYKNTEWHKLTKETIKNKILEHYYDYQQNNLLLDTDSSLISYELVIEYKRSEKNTN